MDKPKTNEDEEIKHLLKEILRKLDDMTIKTPSEKKTSSLTVAQQNILETVRKYIEERDKQPSVEDLAKIENISKSTAAGYLSVLVDKGFLQIIPEHKKFGSRRVRLYTYRPK